MLRPGRDPAEAERPHQLAHAALLVADTEAPLDQSAEINQTPPHHPVLCQLGAVLQATRQLSLLLRVQPPLPARRLAVDQTRRPGVVEAVHPSIAASAGPCPCCVPPRRGLPPRGSARLPATGGSVPVSLPPSPAPVSRLPLDPSAPPPSSVPPSSARPDEASLNKTGKSRTRRATWTVGIESSAPRGSRSCRR